MASSRQTAAAHDSVVREFHTKRAEETDTQRQSSPFRDRGDSFFIMVGTVSIISR